APASARAVQRDYAATATLSWTLDAATYAIWHAWYTLALEYGAAWFSAPAWPMPWGTGAVARFTGPVQVRHLGRGLREVSVDADIRGASDAPAEPAIDMPGRFVPIVDADLVDYGTQLLAVQGGVYELNDEWYRVNADRTALELLGSPTPLGVLINPTRGSLPCGAVQFRGATDAANTLGRLGIVINGDNNTAAAARLSAGTPDRTSLITGSVRGGLVHVLPWPDPIELVHIARVSQTTTYSVVDTGPLTHSASLVEVLRLTFNESDDIRALLVEEYPTTDYAGASGTGSARLVRVRGVQGDTL
ncbi:MAG: hypothetical protein RL375_2430, partial [Pseudomonadota bacterium]